MKTSLVAELVAPATLPWLLCRHLWLPLALEASCHVSVAVTSWLDFEDHPQKTFGLSLEAEGVIQVDKEKDLDEAEALDFVDNKILRWLQLLAAERCH